MKKIVCTIQAILMIWIPFAVHAGPFEDHTSAGQTEGRALVPDAGSIFGVDTTSGQYELNPGSTGEVSLNPAELFPGQTGFDTQAAKDQKDSDTGIANLSDTTNSALQTEASATGEAWRTVIDSHHTRHPDLRNDPIWSTTDSVLSEVFSGMFEDCTQTRTVTPLEETNHLPDIKTCERITNPSGSCTIEHDYSAEWVLESGDSSDYCTPSTSAAHASVSGLSLNVGCPPERSNVVTLDVGFTPWCGWKYSRAHHTATIALDDNPHILTKDIDIWDRADHPMKDNPNLVVADYYRRGCYLSFEGGSCTGTDCDLTFRFVDDYNLNDGYYPTRDSTFHVQMKRPATYVKQVVDTWTPQGCVEDTQAILDEGFCSIPVSCTEPVAGPCTTPEGSVTVCSTELSPSPVPGIDNLCRQVTVGDPVCNWNVGEMACYIDANGEEQCPENTGGNINGCLTYANDTSCRFVSSTCIEGLTGVSGKCYAWEDTYDCGSDITTATNIITETYECKGDTRCIESGGSGSTGAVAVDNSDELSTTERCYQGYVPPDEKLIVTHDYQVDLIKLLGGAGAISSCGVGCLNVWVGRVGNNYWRGRCKIYEQATNLYVTNTDVFTSARIDRAVWDDYMQIYMNTNKMWNGPNSNFPPETRGSCELSTSWNRSLNIDVTDYFKNEGRLDFLTRVSVTGRGEGYSHITAHYDPAKVLRDDEWDMSARLRRALTYKDTSGCNVTITCVDDPIPAGANCGMYRGYQICKDQFAPMPAGLENISPSCRKVEVLYDCGTNDTSSLTTCDTLDNNPSCGFLNGTCIPGFDSTANQCWLEERTYDCTPPDASTQPTQALVCGVRCIGTECVSHEPQISTDFAQAAALMQAAQYIGQDLNCDGTDGGGACRVFEGEVFECKRALGGWVDCCESPGGISLKDYIDLLQAGNKAASAKQWLGVIDNPIAGAWNGAKQVALDGWSAVEKSVTNTFSTITEPFTAAWEGLTGAATDVGAEVTAEGTKTIVGGIVDTLMENTAQWVMDTFGSAAVDAFFTGVAADGTTMAASEVLASNATGTTTAGGTTAGGTVGLGGAILGPIMWAYMIYCIVNILVNIIWKCEQREFELGAKKELKVCHYIGTYCASDGAFGCTESRKAECCFTSPMARIMQEQIRPQLGLSWGTAENPVCDGIPVKDLEKVDWSQVDLSEWIAILSITDNNPQLNPELLDMEAMTGTGNPLDDAMPDQDRDTVIDRTRDRLQGYDPTDTNENMSQGLYGY